MGYNHYRYARKIAGNIEFRDADYEYPKFKIVPNSYITIGMKAGNSLYVQDGPTNILQVSRATNDVVLSASITNGNVTLVPNGTGKVKFGTKTGTGDVAVDGHLDTLDSAGNAIKLATVA